MKCLSPSSACQWCIQDRLRNTANLGIVKIQMQRFLSNKFDVVFLLLKQHKWLVLLIVPQKSKFHCIGRGGWMFVAQYWIFGFVCR